MRLEFFVCNRSKCKRTRKTKFAKFKIPHARALREFRCTEYETYIDYIENRLRKLGTRTDLFIYFELIPLSYSLCNVLKSQNMVWDREWFNY